MARLEIRELDAGPRELDLQAPETLIGRHPACSVVLRDDSVSRRHARILSRGGRYFLEDLRSNNGTQLNGAAIAEQRPLADRDEIHIGSATLVFRDAAAALASTGATIVTSCDGRRGTTLGDPEEKLRALLDLTRNLGVSLDLDEIFPKILETAFRIFPQAERGSVWLAEGADGELRPVSARERGGAVCATPEISRTIAEHVMRDGQAVLSQDAASDQRFEPARSIMVLGTRSLLCAPLLATGGAPLGMVHLDTHSGSAPFCAEDLDVLVNVANLAGHSVEHARLVASRLAYERRERDLHLARGVQEQFLPQSAPEVPGYRVAHHYRPAGNVGGDYFDYVELPGGRLALTLGDVAGKGVSAALLMARLCSDVRFRLLESPDPARAMSALGEQLARRSHAGRFVTLALCVLDPGSHRLEVVNAGHLPPLWRRGSAEPVAVGADEAGPPLGVLPDARYVATTLDLGPGDALLLFTDGYSEARAPSGEMFGTERAHPALAPGNDAPAVVERLTRDVSDFAAGATDGDDLCAVALSRCGEA